MGHLGESVRRYLVKGVSVNIKGRLINIHQKTGRLTLELLLSH